MAIFDFTEAQAAAELGCSARQLSRWRKAGKVPFSQDPGGNIGYTAGQIAEIVHACRRHPVEQEGALLRTDRE